MVHNWNEKSISDIGEFGVIRRLREIFSYRGRSTHSFLGIGDDCAVLELDAYSSILITTDLLLESVHFQKEYMSPHEVGFKSLAVNLSDMAAMGCTPLYAFLSIAVPSDLPMQWMEDFAQGFRGLANEFGVKMVGGDTTRSIEKIFINITLVGESDNEHIKLRSMARPGDILCVTGELGTSSLGLESLKQGMAAQGALASMQRIHKKPFPHVKEGRWLSQYACVHAMMDVSDGVASDIDHICEQSRCGAQIEVASLPRSPHLAEVAQLLGVDMEQYILGGGEDYCLLLSVDSSSYNWLSEEFERTFGRPLYSIGEVVEADDSEPAVSYTRNEQPYVPRVTPFRHF